jgi:hypothetical protein
MNPLLLAAAVALATGLAGAPSTPPSAATGGPSGLHAASPVINPADFVAKIDNPWLPMKPGTTSTFRGTKDGKPARDVRRVTSSTKVILGVRCTVVSDRLYLSGVLAERTLDWYAQDRHGAVWYFGEATAILDAHGNVTSTEGSWTAGVAGAVPGVVMEARPRVNDRYRQEYLKGHAEDQARVASLDASVSVPYGRFTHLLQTKEWTVLEPGVVDQKLYARGIGELLEGAIKGGNEQLVLVSISH